MSDADGSAAVTVRVARALESAGIEYMVGGSIASSWYGEPRSTADIDFAIRVAPAEVSALARALGEDFAVDEDMIADAARTGRSANVFFLPFFTKVDLFVRGQSEYDRSEFGRATSIEPLPGEPVRASSVEDSLLWKLRWFRLGGEISDQQWRDVLGLLRIRGDRLDLAYVRGWAARFGVEDLLDRALAQSSP